jgi:hypothetical protein
MPSRTPLPAFVANRAAPLPTAFQAAGVARRAGVQGEARTGAMVRPSRTASPSQGLFRKFRKFGGPESGDGISTVVEALPQNRPVRERTVRAGHRGLASGHSSRAMPGDVGMAPPVHRCKSFFRKIGSCRDARYAQDITGLLLTIFPSGKMAMLGRIGAAAPPVHRCKRSSAKSARAGKHGTRKASRSSASPSSRAGRFWRSLVPEREHERPDRDDPRAASGCHAVHGPDRRRCKTSSGNSIYSGTAQDHRTRRVDVAPRRPQPPLQRKRRRTGNGR